MPFLDDLFGGGDEDTEVTTTQQIPPYLENYYRDLATYQRQNLRDADRITVQNRQYQPYQGQRIAGFTEPTRQSWQTIQNSAERYDPIFNRGRDRAEDSAMRYNPSLARADRNAGGDATVLGNRGDIARLMNPFTDSVIDRTTAAIERQGEQQRVRDQARAGRAGAAGGGRLGVVDALRNEDVNRNIGDINATLRAGSYDRAVSTLQGDLTRRLTQAQTQAGIANTRGNLDSQNARDLTAIAGQRQQLDNTRAGSLATIGNQQQGQDQASLDLAYRDFQEQRDYPFELFQFQQGAAGGQPQGPTNTTQTTEGGGGPGPLGQIAGLGLAGLGIYGQFGGFN